MSAVSVEDAGRALGGSVSPIWGTEPRAGRPPPRARSRRAPPTGQDSWTRGAPADPGPPDLPPRRSGSWRRARARRPGEARHRRPMRRSVLWDSSAILALLDADDAD